MISFGERIFNERMARGWSLREASAHIGISHTYLASIEKEYDPRSGNPVTPSPDSLLKICNAYGIPFRDTEPIFKSVNEGDLLKFLITQLRLLRKTDRRMYQTVLSDAEKD
ncbi:MAG: helix-turn-helix transcriptional regulator [Clostridia bacterium]|nr:helix-turn-helix transcriptional regulator [Clostridia bacterium]MBQ4322831.1 helix-turn-helix transcriptional regulator [Clostridia bacterium]